LLPKTQNIFDEIKSRHNDMVDRPLMYEWNAWRSMVLVNDALNVQGNYHTDADGNPVATASGNMPDILCEYETFWLGVEVTLQHGVRQYESEGESIIRHIGNLQKSRMGQEDKRPVYGLFIAEKIHPEVVSHLHFAANRYSQLYAGKVRILPVERKNFVDLAESALHHPNFSSRVVQAFLEDMFSQERAEMGEIDWFHLVQAKTAQMHFY